MQINLWINGKQKQLEVEVDEFLSDTLRKNGYLSVKIGCDTGSCGICTVWIEGKPILSCSMLSVKAEGKNITTIEGVQSEAKEFADFLNKEGAVQCGFCSPGFIMTVLAMKKELKNPKEEEILQYLTGNLCRCTGYVGQLRAVKKYMEIK